jgi:hypothetical protein
MFNQELNKQTRVKMLGNYISEQLHCAFILAHQNKNFNDHGIAIMTNFMVRFCGAYFTK